MMNGKAAGQSGVINEIMTALRDGESCSLNTTGVNWKIKRKRKSNRRIIQHETRNVLLRQLTYES